MRTTKDMMLQSQKNAIRLATDSLHFGQEIRNKNLYGQEAQNQSVRMVFKRENQDTLSILLETMIQLLENLRFHQSAPIFQYNKKYGNKKLSVKSKIKSIFINNTICREICNRLFDSFKRNRHLRIQRF